MGIDRQYSKTPLALAVGTILAGTAAAPAALAQSDEGDRIEEIVVTATRREESVLDIPYNISAISGELIDRAQIQDNWELMRNVAGASVVDRGYRNAGVINGIMIRGLNVDSAAFGDYALNTVPTVSTYVNDTPIYANFVLKDISRVEVLRGPQGTLYGSGSLGGTVRYIMNEPDPSAFSGELETSISQTADSDGQNYTADAIFNIPVGERSAFRFFAGTLQLDGVVDYVNVYVTDANGIPVAPNGVLDPAAEFRNVEDADDVDIKYGRAAFLADLTDNVSLSLSYHAQTDDIGGRRHQTVGIDGFGDSYGDREIGSVQLEPSSRDVSLASMEIDVDLGFATLTSSTSTYQHEGDSISENTGFYAQLGWLADYYYNYPRPMASAFRTYEDDAFVQEFRLVSAGDNTVDWIVGAFYRDQDLLSTQTSFLRGFEAWADAAFGDPTLVVRDIDFDYSRDETFTDLGLFGELVWHVSDTFRLTGGLRYFDVEFDNDTYMSIGVWDPSIFQIEDRANFSDSEDDVLFKLNASWDLTDDSMLYATISEGYRRGGANAVPLSGPFAEDPGWLTYDSDSVTNYELGIKGRTPNLQYSAAVFLVDWDDVQLNAASTNWAFFTAANGDSARTSGMEFELNGYLTDEWSYALGYAFVDAELTADALAPVANPYVLAMDGAELPGTAEHTLNGTLTYTAELASGRVWTTRLNGYYQSDTQNSLGDFGRSPGTFRRELDSFTLWNVVSTLSFDRWNASLFVKNVTDEEAVTGLFTEAYMGTSPAQNYVGNGSKQFIARPRTIGLSVSYDF